MPNRSTTWTLDTNGVTAPDPVEKTPGESLLTTMDFTAILGAGETLSGTPTVTITNDDQTAGTLPTTSGSPAIVGSTVTQRILGGTGGSDYRVSIAVSTSASNTREGDGILEVRSR